MKLHCHRPSLIAAFQTVSGVIPSRTPKEILKNVKLHVADGKATLIGTSEQVGIRYEIPGVEIESAGETLLPTSEVNSILRELTDDGVNIEITDDAVWIRAGQSEFRLPARDPAEFPPVAAFDDQTFYTIEAKALKEAIRRTVFATDIESTRYALGGVLVELSPESITMAATDSRRLAVVKGVCRSEGVQDTEAARPVIPREAMTLIEKSIGDSDEQIAIAAHANEVLIRCANSTIFSRLVEGRFPKYQDVIPAESTSTIDLLVGPFYSIVRQAQIVTNDESRGVEFAFADGTLTLTSQSPELGQSKVEMPISYDGEPLSITFDPRFVADFLRILEPDKQIALKLVDAESAAVFCVEDAYTYVVMPLSRDR